VDEVLSVGDMHFQEKSINKMKSFKQAGAAIIFVSHSLSAIRNFCDRCIWLKHGELILDDNAEVVCSEYQKFMDRKDETDKVQKIDKSGIYDEKYKKIKIKKCTTNRNEYITGDDIFITTTLKMNEQVKQYGFGLLIYDKEGKLVTTFNTVREDIILSGTNDKIVISIKDNDFLRGYYYISVSVSDEMIMFSYDRVDFICKFFVNDRKNSKGVPVSEGMFRCKHEWLINGQGV
jgi:ABC-type multidrug transport system ATPase subunit